MNVRIEPSWKEVLAGEFEKDYFSILVSFVKSEYENHKVYPHPKSIFRAFDKTPFDKVKVVILGQDPYHGHGQANGLAFSVSESVAAPPSLENIYKEIADDLGKEMPNTGSLEHWAEQGVLLLNTTLTVRAGNAGSHQGKGWEQLTDAAIVELGKRRKNIVFLLWGSHAQKKGELINKRDHFVLEAPHPSPLSAHRGFFGCRHFSTANAYLIMHGKSPINW